MLCSVPEVLRPAVEVPRYTQTHLPVKGMVVGTWGRLLVKSSEKWMGPTFRVAISTCWGDEHTMVMRGGGGTMLVAKCMHSRGREFSPEDEVPAA